MNLKWLIRLQLALSAALFGLIVLGAGVRLADAGLSCPDWPLCFGLVVPTFNTQIFLEWIHRVIAMCVGFIALYVSVIIFSRAELRQRLAKYSIAILLLFLFQAYLGRQTVIELLRAEIVTSHLIGGYSLFALNLLLARRLMEIQSPPQKSLFPSFLKRGFLVVFILSFLQAVLGALVSSHYAGQVCPDFPLCQGQIWPGFETLMGLHMLHRFGALALVLGIIMLTVYCFQKTSNAKLRNISRAGLLFVLLQIVWGVSMIMTQVHPGLSLAHSFTALSIFTFLLIGTDHVYRR